MFQVQRDGKPAMPPAPTREWAERDQASLRDADRDLKLGQHRYRIVDLDKPARPRRKPQS